MTKGVTHIIKCLQIYSVSVHGDIRMLDERAKYMSVEFHGVVHNNVVSDGAWQLSLISETRRKHVLIFF